MTPEKKGSEGDELAGCTQRFTCYTVTWQDTYRPPVHCSVHPRKQGLIAKDMGQWDL